MFYLFLILLVVNACKPICKNNIFFNTTHQLMNELEYTIQNEIKILELEIKMTIIARTIQLHKQIDEEFEELTNKHKSQYNKYESTLASIGLTPAREDEIYKIIEMEQAARNGIVQSIYSQK
jgi:hypothetical protein